jgi:hypothetical protein
MFLCSVYMSCVFIPLLCFVFILLCVFCLFSFVSLLLLGLSRLNSALPFSSSLSVLFVTSFIYSSSLVIYFTFSNVPLPPLFFVLYLISLSLFLSISLSLIVYPSHQPFIFSYGCSFVSVLLRRQALEGYPWELSLVGFFSLCLSLNLCLSLYCSFGLRIALSPALLDVFCLCTFNVSSVCLSWGSRVV